MEGELWFIYILFAMTEKEKRKTWKLIWILVVKKNKKIIFFKCLAWGKRKKKEKGERESILLTNLSSWQMWVRSSWVLNNCCIVPDYDKISKVKSKDRKVKKKKRLTVVIFSELGSSRVFTYNKCDPNWVPYTYCSLVSD